MKPYRVPLSVVLWSYLFGSTMLWKPLKATPILLWKRLIGLLVFCQQHSASKPAEAYQGYLRETHHRRSSIVKLLQRTLGETDRHWALQITHCCGSLDYSRSQMPLFIVSGIWKLKKKEIQNREGKCFLKSSRKAALAFEGLIQLKWEQ